MIIIIFIFQMIGYHSFAQNDTLFIHISETVDFYPLNDIDSLTFHQGSQTTEIQFSFGQDHLFYQNIK